MDGTLISIQALMSVLNCTVKLLYYGHHWNQHELSILIREVHVLISEVVLYT